MQLINISTKHISFYYFSLNQKSDFYICIGSGRSVGSLHYHNTRAETDGEIPGVSPTCLKGPTGTSGSRA